MPSSAPSTATPAREPADVEATILGLVRDVPDYPKPGVLFKDITPLLADPGAFATVVDAIAAPFRGDGARVDLVAGIEARGFILAAPVAIALGAGFVPVRKRGKLPARTVGASYALEYGTADIEMHTDAVAPGQRVLVVDDVLATGGTAAAACALVQELGGEVVGVTVLMELGFLGGRGKLPDAMVRALLTL